MKQEESKYVLDRLIDEPDLKEAVQMASYLIDKDGKTIDEAVNIAGEHFNKDMTDIRLHLPRDICEKAPANDYTNYRLFTDVSLDKCFKLIAVILSDHNMCCCETKAPYLLTMIPHKDGNHVYSCQCACGGWCTNGHGDPFEAVKEYEAMCDRYIKKHRKKK